MRGPCLIVSPIFASAALVWVGGVTIAVPSAAYAVQLRAQSTEAQMVTVTVTPHQLAAGKAWEFDVAFSTHVQPLDEDLMQSAFLVDASGQRRGPLAWRGDGPGGHHRKGVLVFAPLEPRPATVELQIQRSGESVPRSFKRRLE